LFDLGLWIFGSLIAFTLLVLLRLVQELKEVKLEDELTQAFLEAGFTGEGRVPSPPALEASTFLAARAGEGSGCGAFRTRATPEGV
jgi:hypothetical protein